MSNENLRRSSVPFGTPDTIPTAPPLPAPRPLQRARDAATRFFGYQSRPVSPQNSPPDDSFIHGARTRYASLSVSQNATGSHRTGLEINTIAINESGTHALLGGKEIFKTIKVEDGRCAEETNLRSAIRSNPYQASGKTRQIYAIDIADVAWAKGDCGNYVAAATSSGKIILYDLGHAGLQAAQLHEHFRQVHNVTFNPHRGSLLLSGSQDGTVRLWDVRDVRQASTLQSKRKYSGQSDGVRDVKWSPTEGVDFAFGTDSGWIQRWDMRNLKTAKVKIPAHSETCNTIDWHPDGKHIVSASSDRTIRVWDFSGTRKQKANWEIKTPYPVLIARWRPPCESSMPFDNGARQCTQLVTAYDQQHPMLHIWDFRRPALPFREMAPYHSAPTDLIWHSQDLLWTVGREGVFLQSDIQHAPKIIDRRNLQAFAVSPKGDINFVTQKRRRHRVNKGLGLPSFATKSSSFSHRQESDFLSRSWADDSLDQSFLSMLPPKRGRRSTNHSRAHSISSTADSYDQKQPSILKLDHVLLNRKSFKPRQSAVRGPVLGDKDSQVFSFLAREYKIDKRSIFEDDNLVQGLRELIEHNAHCAEYIGLYRLAQTWKIIGFSVTTHIKDRRRRTYESWKVSRTRTRRSTDKATLISIARDIMKESRKSPTPTPSSMRPVSTITQQLTKADVTSDQLTPLAGPVASGKSSDLDKHNALPDLDKDSSLILPPSLSPKVSQPEVISNGRHQGERRLTSSNLSDLQKLQQDINGIDKADMVHKWNVQPKQPLDLDTSEQQGVRIPPKLEKHDSNESFTFLEGSFDSRGPSFPSSMATNGSGPLELVAERPSRLARTQEAPKEIERERSVPLDIRPASAGVTSALNSQNLSGRPRSAHRPSEDDIIPNGTSEMKNRRNGIADHDRHIFPYPGEDRRSPSKPVSARLWTNGTAQQPAAHTSHGSPHRKALDHDKYAPAISLTADMQEHSLQLHEDSDSDNEMNKPFQLVDMVRELVSYYAANADAQTAAHILLLLGSVLPRSRGLGQPETFSTVSAYVDCFTHAGHERDVIENILQQYLEPMIRSGLQPLQSEAILSTYHEQLVAQQLRQEAAILRKLSYPAYPAVYDMAVKDNYVSLQCGKCGEPIVTGIDLLHCESCRLRQGSCAVCWSNDSPFENSIDTAGPPSKLLSTCLLCNHSGHAACLRMWFGESGEVDGACPTEGCLCDCVTGIWRSEKLKLAERKRHYRSHSRVKSDDWSAKESKAVERTRVVLGVKSSKHGRSGFSA